MAEGADRLVPRAALAAFTAQRVGLEAVLPLTVLDYLEDFKSDSSREEFRRLLDQSHRTTLARTTLRYGDERDAAYERAGHYIVDHSDVMIAVWNRREPGGRGGTATIVRYAREHRVPVLVAPTSGPPEAEQRHTGAEIDEHSPRLRAAVEAFNRIEEYNRSSIRDGRLAQEIESTRRRLALALGTSSIEPQFECVTSWAVPHLVRADLLALRYQSRYRILARMIHLLAALAVAAVAAQIVFAPDQPDWLGVEIGLLSVLLVAVWAGRHGRWHDRWIGYRSLAEAFRSALFLVLSGVRNRHEDESQRKVNRAEEPWFQRAFTEAWRPANCRADRGRRATAPTDRCCGLDRPSN